MQIFSGQIREARIHLKQNLRKRYEAGEITKKAWKEAKKILKNVDIAAFLRSQNND